MKIAAVEAGGTKFVVGLFSVDENGARPPVLLERDSVPTTSPAETLSATGAFIQEGSRKHGAIDAIGIGSFGPVDLKPSSAEWGHITSTPKPGWSRTNVAGWFRERFKVPVAFDTDVNAAAYGEFLWGAARGVLDFVYITVGTGIGGGIFSGGNLVHGLSHPELGHVKLAREASDPYPGRCPYHRDCLEGLASGPAIAERWGRPPESLPADHEAWELEAIYLARAMAAYALVISPELILLGGGVGLRPGLAERVSVLLGAELAGYIPALAKPEKLTGYVRRPELAGNAGLVGSVALALRFCDE